MVIFNKIMVKQSGNDEIKKANNKIGEYSINSSKKEIQELNNILNESEECKYITLGFAFGDTWVIAITTNRLIFLHKKFNGDIKKEERNINDIKFCEFKSGFANSKVEIGLNNEYIIISNIYKEYVEGLVNSIVEEKIKYIMVENNIYYEKAEVIWNNTSKEYKNIQN